MYKAESPTKSKIILVTTDMLPKIDETKSNLKNPTNPQLRPPITTKIQTIQPNVLFFMNFVFIVYFKVY